MRKVRCHQMKIIDAEHFFEVIRKEDLSYMQQTDLMDCIKDMLDREPAVEVTAPESEKKINGKFINGAYWNELIFGNFYDRTPEQIRQAGFKHYRIRFQCIGNVAVWARSEDNAKEILQEFTDDEIIVYADFGNKEKHISHVYEDKLAEED